jgi:L-alanine-DL-glutamate epimerase-like enolase superfamily enzyme
MKITDLRTVLLTGPISNDPSMVAATPRRSAAFVEIETNAGFVGIGETYLGYHMPRIIPVIVDYFAPILLHADDPLDIHALRQRMVDCCMYWGRVGVGPTVICAIEAALWDLKGKLLGVPVYELLGGRRHDRLPAYATGGSSNWPLDRLLAKVDFYLGLGFTGFKVGGASFDERKSEHVRFHDPMAIVAFEVAKVEALRNHVGPDVKIMLDGHMGFRYGPDQWSLSTATALLEALEPYDLFFFEEPLPYGDPHAYAELRASTGVRVAGGEQLTTYEEFRPFAEADSFDIAQPDAGWQCISDFIRIASLFDHQRRQVATHGWGSGGAAMQNIHAAFATPNVAILELPPAAGPLHTEVWGDSLQMVNGEVLAPTTPGLGIALSDEVKEAFPFVPGVEELQGVPGKQMLR